MTPVIQSFMDAFQQNGFECELIESEKEDQVRIPVTGDTFGPRLLVVRFLHNSNLVAAVLPDLLEIPKGKSAIALRVANEFHRSSHIVKFWIDKKNRSLWSMSNTFVRENDAVDMVMEMIGVLMDYSTRVVPVFEDAMGTE